MIYMQKKEKKKEKETVLGKYRIINIVSLQTEKASLFCTQF